MQEEDSVSDWWYTYPESNVLSLTFWFHYWRQQQERPLTMIGAFVPIAASVMTFAAVVGMMLWWTLRRRRRARELLERQEQLLTRRRARTDSLGRHSSIRRFFQHSFDMTAEHFTEGTNGNGEDDILFDDVEIAKLEEHDRIFSAQTAKRFAYKGPLVHSISHKTMTPPPTWTEASRLLLPSHDRNWNLHQSVSLNIGRTPTITFRRQPTVVVVAAAAAATTTTTTRRPDVAPMSSSSSTASTKEDLTSSVHEVAVHVKPPIAGAILETYIKDSSREE